MNIHLGDLPIGKWRYLTENETQTLMKLTHQDATPISKNNV
jgi:16S rRNA U516 pseudouridylate synthase RsuA-like enzyme